MAPMKPILAITMGDPTGVGPETIAGAWSHSRLHTACHAVVLGHPKLMQRALQVTGSPVEVIEVTSLDAVKSNSHEMPCLACCDDHVLDLPPARVSPVAGQAAFEAIRLASELALSRQVDGIVTAPINKAAFAAAGHRFPGHTELLAHLCRVQDVAMMLYLAPGENVQGRVGLGVAHVTLHMAMRDAIDNLTQDRILKTSRLVDRVTRALSGSSADADPPRIGVCALNPHAGEDTLFGSEEQQTIRPAVERGLTEGLSLEGPIPADSLMPRAAAGEFDAIVAMYHDQGHIALKLLAMYQAVNITLGLPVIRTSVAHGTAFDLAWKGQARSDAMIEAIDVANRLVSRREHLTWHAP